MSLVKEFVNNLELVCTVYLVIYTAVFIWRGIAVVQSPYVLTIGANKYVVYIAIFSLFVSLFPTSWIK